MNTIVDLIYNFLISWGKRRDIIDQRIENIVKEYQKFVERYIILSNKLDLALHNLEESKARHNIVGKNNDYIKNEVDSIRNNLGGLLSKVSLTRDSLLGADTRQDISEVKKLVQEVNPLFSHKYMSEYSLALKEAEKHLAPSNGLSYHDSPKEDSKIIIRQNNTILQLLVQISDKLKSEQLNKEIWIPSSGLVSSSRNINSDKWNDLKFAVEEIKPSN